MAARVSIVPPHPKDSRASVHKLGPWKKKERKNTAPRSRRIIFPHSLAGMPLMENIRHSGNTLAPAISRSLIRNENVELDWVKISGAAGVRAIMESRSF